jgi:hypothetical protein
MTNFSSWFMSGLQTNDRRWVQRAIGDPHMLSLQQIVPDIPDVFDGPLSPGGFLGVFDVIGVASIPNSSCTNTPGKQQRQQDCAHD